MAKKNTYFFIYIDPFIWLYLLVTGKIFSRILCYRMKYVPKWNIERLVVADIKLEKFSDCQKQAAEFTEKKLSYDKERTVLIDNISIPIGAYRIREKMKIVADVFTSVEVIKNSNYQNLKVYLNSPLFSDDDYDSICEYIVLNTSANCRKSFFINRVHGVLIKALCCLVCVFVVLLNIFKQPKEKLLLQIIYLILLPIRMVRWIQRINFPVLFCRKRSMVKNYQLSIS